MTPTEQTPTKITPKRFSVIIEELVRTKRLTHFEAVMYYCEQNGLEAHTITKWIDKGMREKIQYNAEELNYLPKTSSLFEFNDRLRGISKLSCYETPFWR